MILNCFSEMLCRLAILPTQISTKLEIENFINSFITILNDFAQNSSHGPPQNQTYIVNVWNQDIPEALTASRKATKNVTTSGKLKDNRHITSIYRRHCRQTLRKHIRCANAESRYFLL